MQMFNKLFWIKYLLDNDNNIYCNSDDKQLLFISLAGNYNGRIVQIPLLKHTHAHARARILFINYRKVLNKIVKINFCTVSIRYIIVHEFV